MTTPNILSPEEIFALSRQNDELRSRIAKVEERSAPIRAERAKLKAAIEEIEKTAEPLREQRAKLKEEIAKVEVDAEEDRKTLEKNLVAMAASRAYFESLVESMKAKRGPRKNKDQEAKATTTQKKAVKTVRG